jgi:hypothetical protein
LLAPWLYIRDSLPRMGPVRVHLHREPSSRLKRSIDVCFRCLLGSGKVEIVGQALCCPEVAVAAQFHLDAWMGE